MPDRPPQRGDIWFVAFDPSIGGEIRKTRPAVIVSNDIANRELNRVQAVPLTSIVAPLSFRGLCHSEQQTEESHGRPAYHWS